MCLCCKLFCVSNVLFCFVRVESGFMDNGKTPIDLYTPGETSEVSMFDLETD